jgi:hypothetical protein
MNCGVSTTPSSSSLACNRPDKARRGWRYASPSLLWSRRSDRLRHGEDMEETSMRLARVALTHLIALDNSHSGQSSGSARDSSKKGTVRPPATSALRKRPARRCGCSVSASIRSRSFPSQSWDPGRYARKAAGTRPSKPRKARFRRRLATRLVRAGSLPKSAIRARALRTVRPLRVRQRRRTGRRACRRPRVCEACGSQLARGCCEPRRRGRECRLASR